jgi:hypothetical protein
MISDRAWYFVAAGVLAFGLSHSLLNSGADWVAQVSDRTLASVQQISMGATDCPGRAQILLGRNHVNIPAVQIKVAQMQARVACRRSVLARHKAEMIRLQTDNAQMIFGEQ